MKIILIASIVLATGFSYGITAQTKENNKINIDLAVTANGFEPKSIDVKPGSNVVLNVTRKTETTCATQIQVPAKDIKVELPLNRTVAVALGKLEKGEIKFGCGMSMMESGQILVK